MATPLPLAEKLKHLGIDIVNEIDGCEFDMQVKRAKYIDKNIELNEEFYLVNPSTKVQIIQIYNSHCSWSPLWDLFGPV